MPPTLPKSRILAIALRSRRFGFAILEEPLRLLDWGLVFYERSSLSRIEAAKRKVGALIGQCAPSVVVLDRSAALSAQTSGPASTVLNIVRRETSFRSIPVHVIKREHVRATFQYQQARSKHEIASTIADMFPELQWRLPPKRKIWDKEHPRMTTFDAVAVALAYWSVCSTRNQAA